MATNRKKNWKEAIVEAAQEVIDTLGVGYGERNYEKALLHEFRLRDIPYDSQRHIEITYKGYSLGLRRPDIIVSPAWSKSPGNEYPVEVKIWKTKITKQALNQLRMYLNAMNLPKGLLLNFNTHTAMIDYKEIKSDKKYLAQSPVYRVGKSRKVLRGLRDAASIVFKEFGSSFFYDNRGLEFYTNAIKVELLLKGFVTHERTYPITYKNQQITVHTYDYVFSSGDVVKVISDKSDKLGEELKKQKKILSKMNKQFHIQNGYIIAIPEDDDEGRVIIEKV